MKIKDIMEDEMPHSGNRYLIYTKDYQRENGVGYIPIYMVMLLLDLLGLDDHLAVAAVELQTQAAAVVQQEERFCGGGDMPA